MESNFTKLIKWIGVAFEDGNGQTSMKRVIAFLLTMAAIFVIIYTAVNSEKAEQIQWASTVGLLTALFAMISVLIGASVIEKKHILDSSQPPVEEKVS